VLRRLEARGEVRGGQFVNGCGGEQFAWPGAIEGLRRARHEDEDREVMVVAVDPLNLAGIVTPGERVPARVRNRVWYRGGIPVAAQVAGKLLDLEPVAPATGRAQPDSRQRGQHPVPYLPAAAEMP
jgi:ATP-dependent Lhr-like helicase